MAQTEAWARKMIIIKKEEIIKELWDDLNMTNILGNWSLRRRREKE